MTIQTLPPGERDPFKLVSAIRQIIARINPVISTGLGAISIVGGVHSTSTLTLISTVSSNSSTDAIIFQTGTQSTRGRITSGGTFIVGISSTAVAFTNTPALQVTGTAGSTSSFGVARFTNSSTNPPRIELGFSRGTTVGSLVSVQAGDQIGELNFMASSTGDLVLAARIRSIFESTAARLNFEANNYVFGLTSVASSATDGFIYAVTCSGAPTATPTAYTGMAPIVIDAQNKKLYFFAGGSWNSA